MSLETGPSEKLKLATTADLMARGASLLSEACPRCGGVQIQFRGKVYCINEDDISNITTSPVQKAADPSPTAPLVQSVVSEQQQSVPPPTTASTDLDSDKGRLKAMLEEKLEKVSKQLENSQDFDQQEKLLGLISKYLDTLSKLKSQDST